MSDESPSDKQYEASQSKLDEARKKGEIARSTDLNTSAAYAGILLVGLSTGAGLLIQTGEILSDLLSTSAERSVLLFGGSGTAAFGGVLRGVTLSVLPWFALPAVLVLASIAGQRGFVFAPTKLAFKGSRISPIDQAKNKFGRSGLFEFTKSFVKLLLYSTVLFVFILKRLPEFMAAMSLSPGQVTALLMRLSLSLMTIVFVIALSLGVIDYFWQRAEHLRKNRMSHKELTDETKNAEGDPAMKQQRRQKGMEIAMSQMLSDIPDADVVIVNPTHFAVVLTWDRGNGSAPVCVAKGVDHVALQIRKVAQEAGVPIHSDPPAARAIYAGVEIGSQIDLEHYEAVAAAIRFADRLRKVARK